MPRIQVCMSPALLSLYDVEECTAVVTDVLRATTTMIEALDIGVLDVIPVSDVDVAKTYLQRPNYKVAGERNGKKIEHFDFGNSPIGLREHADELKNKHLVITTTNGTRALQAVSGAQSVYIGALTNVRATAKQLSKENNDILVLCAGWKNRVNLEDSLFAGALCSALEDNFEIYGDAAIMCQQLFLDHKSDLIGAIKNATHYNRLKNLGIEEDIQFCMTLNTSSTVAKSNAEGIIQQVFTED